MSAPTPKEIREAFQEYRNEWREVYDEGQTDMRFISGDPWDAADRDARRQAGRPCLSLDELNQYLNQYVNNLRQQKLGIKVTPEGDGANDEDAKNRANIIRGIEYKSNAPAGAYITAAESAASRGYGFAILRTEYKDDDSFDQCIRIQRVANPDTILINPFYKQADASDIEDGFIVQKILKSKFKEKYPKAEVTDFSGTLMGEQGVSDWVTDKYVQEGEYWKVEHDYRTLLLVESPEGSIKLSGEDYQKLSEATGKKYRVIRERRVAVPKVMQYMTNGLEVLDEVPWHGSRIPIISCFGKELWMNEGGRATRKLFSLVRLARDPQMLFAYLATQECELAGMVPKTPWVGYKGQFEDDKERWENATQVPTSYLQVNIVVDGANGQVLPLPQRQSFDAPFQEYEIAKDSARRSIQSAMGISPLPTAAQRDSEKSKVALDKIDQMESVGSFHFADNFKHGFLNNAGYQINELITPILDTQRDEPITKPDGTHGTLAIVGNTSHPLDENGAYEVQGVPGQEASDDQPYHTGKGNFGVTISDGPNFESEREEQSEFVDHLVANWQELGINAAVANKVLAKLIRMKDLGTVGEDIANLLDPPDPQNLPPQVQAIVAQKDAQIQQLGQENQALHMDRAGRVLEQQTKIQLQQMKSDTDKQLAQLQNDIKVLVAEIQAKSQDSAERIQMYKEFWLENHGAAHEIAMQKDQQGHDMRQAIQSAQSDAQSQAAEHAQQQTLATQAASVQPEQGQ